jgi:hypothetical protein
LLAQWNSDREARVFRVFLESTGVTILLDLDGGLVVESPGGQVIFGDLDCEGQAFVPRRYVGRLTGEGGRFFVGRRVPSVDPEYQSRQPGVNCYNDQNSGPQTNMVPADEVMLEDLGIEFPRPGPLYVGLPAAD